jgi:hypothetical protein
LAPWIIHRSTRTAMHRTFFLLPAALLFSSSLTAQTKTDKANVSWGPDQNARKDGTFDNVIDDDGDVIYQLISRKHDLFVQRMDAGLHADYQKQLDLELDKKKLSLEHILITQDNVVVFASYYDKKLDENQLYTETYAKSDFAPVNRLTKIARIAAEKARRSGFFDVEVSPDKSKVLVYMAKPHEKGGDGKLEMHVFDGDMKPIWSKDITMPSDGASFDQVEIDNDGSIVGLGKKYAEKHEAKELKREGKATYENHLLVITKDDDAPQDFPITVQDKFLQDMTLQMGTTGNIICGGLFSNKGTWSIRGTFFLSLDRQTKQIVHESYKDFSDNFITQYMTEKEARKATKKANRKGEEMELPDYDLHEIILRDDGGAVMIAEQYHMQVVTTTSSTPNGGTVTTTTYHYFYNDIIVVSIDPEGNIDWAAKVPKRQHSINDGGRYSSYAAEVKDGNIFLIFNDSGENLFVKPGDKIKQFELKGKDALVVLATVDNKGNVAREALFSPERRDAILRPKDCVELSNDKMFIYASRKKEYRFGEIEFK